MRLTKRYSLGISALCLILAGCSNPQVDTDCDTIGELTSAAKQLTSNHNSQLDRYLGQPLDANHAVCRGADPQNTTPWTSWGKYFATGDASSGYHARLKFAGVSDDYSEHGLDLLIRENLASLPTADFRGLTGALLDLEVQRMELINLNLYGNYTFEQYIKGNGITKGRNLKKWPQMQLSNKELSKYQKGTEIAVNSKDEQHCLLPLLNHRTTNGVCNDVYNPKMGSTGTLFARNVRFDATFPDYPVNEEVKNRHGDRLSNIYHPNPQQISDLLFSRDIDPNSADFNQCNDGTGLKTGELDAQGRPIYSTNAQCGYTKAPFFNVLAAFWIQFMTHDWFSHLKEGHNDKSKRVGVGCTPQMAAKTGCSPKDTVEEIFIAQDGPAPTFEHKGKTYQTRAHKTTANFNTAWWDASQIYGYDELSENRVIRDPQDNAKLLMEQTQGLKGGYLPSIDACTNNCEVQPHWHGQESAAFPDNWSIGLSFYHNLFVREHNSFVAAFREKQKATPNDDSGILADLSPDGEATTKTYKDVTDDEIYNAARLVVSAQIAKIHTIEWTPQLLYNEPLHRAMNSNWYGLLSLASDEADQALLQEALDNKATMSEKLAKMIGRLKTLTTANELYSAIASGSGIFGINNGMRFNKDGLMRPKRAWGGKDLKKFNAGINHFGSPFNFPEEFTSVYRLHPLVPDLIEFRGDVNAPNKVSQHIPLVNTVRAEATPEIQRGLENWALSMGRQRLGALFLNNSPLFLQNLSMPHLGPDNKMDIVALDVIRDRQRGVPKFNELRRQIGLPALTSFDDFINQDATGDALAHQQVIVKKLRKLYGSHTCDNSKTITSVQTNRAIANKPHYKIAYGDGGVNDLIDDCLGHANGTQVDNIEDLDLVVGWLAETTRPHGYAISETQFHIFIINASRRLFSDRFFTSSFRPEFYSHLGVDWVNNNGPVDAQSCPAPLMIGLMGYKLACLEPKPDNGHVVEASTMKRLLMRNIPELKEELMPVINVFDPWARKRGAYYSVDWKPRKGAESDPAFNE